MPKVHLIESHQKNLWFVDLWSDGTIEAFSTYRRRVNITHRLQASSPHPLESALPLYVQEMINDAADLYLWTKREEQQVC